MALARDHGLCRPRFRRRDQDLGVTGGRLPRNREDVELAALPAMMTGAPTLLGLTDVTGGDDGFSPQDLTDCNRFYRVEPPTRAELFCTGADSNQRARGAKVLNHLGSHLQRLSGAPSLSGLAKLYAEKRIRYGIGAQTGWLTAQCSWLPGPVGCCPGAPGFVDCPDLGALAAAVVVEAPIAADKSSEQECKTYREIGPSAGGRPRR